MFFLFWRHTSNCFNLTVLAHLMQRKRCNKVSIAIRSIRRHKSYKENIQVDREKERGRMGGRKDWWSKQPPIHGEGDTTVLSNVGVAADRSQAKSASISLPESGGKANAKQVRKGNCWFVKRRLSPFSTTLLVYLNWPTTSESFEEILKSVSFNWPGRSSLFIAGPDWFRYIMLRDWIAVF